MPESVQSKMKEVISFLKEFSQINMELIQVTSDLEHMLADKVSLRK